MMSSYNAVTTAPSAFITKNRQRIRQYNDTVYLKNGDEFEIEIHNPLQTTVLAKIKINGKSISNTGLIVKPGARVFLERYFDNPRKFKFETYEVTGSQENLKAIELNGLLDVEFFLEEEISPTFTYVPPVYSQPIWYNYNTPWDTPICGNVSFTTANTGAHGGGICSTTITGGINYNATGGDEIKVKAFNQSGDLSRGSSDGPNLRRLTRTKSVETGRVESGSHSNQSFTMENRRFNRYYFNRISWKLLPESVKPYEVKDIKSYCPSCGTKVKKSSHKFCYNCGGQLN